MRINLIIIVLLSLFACKSEQTDKTKEIEEEVRKLPLKKIAETHPFKEAEYIYIYAHPYEMSEDGMTEVTIMNDSVMFSGDKEIAYVVEADKVKIEKAQIEELFDMLYNFPCENALSAECFDPRHTLIFYDKEDKTFAQIRICLECNNMRVDDGSIIDLCDNDRQAEALKKFFKKAGVNYLGERKNQFQIFKDRYKEIMPEGKAVTDSLNAE